MENNLRTAFNLRFIYYNFYENKEKEWHEKYKNHSLYSAVVKSFEYDFKDIGKLMPKILEEFEKKL